jgi:thiol-disulfide isomerase/thioredoxin
MTAERNGKPLLITFWATTCSSCVKEMPHLIELQSKFGSQIDIVGVAMFYDELEQVEALIQRRNLNYNIVYDQSGKVAEAFGGIRLTPTSFLISPQGQIIYQKIGDIDFGRIEQEITTTQSKQG